MIFVYVLISNNENFINEQALLSIYSLKEYNDNARIIVLVDNDTYNNLQKGKAVIYDYVEEIKIIDLPKNLSAVQRSRFIKTSLPEIIFEDFVYLDNDTIITDSLSELDNLKFDICAIYNQHRNDWNSNNIHPMLNTYQSITGLIPYSDFYVSNSLFNGGVLICKNTGKTRIFFKKWHELWLNDSLNLGFDKDQVSLWRTNYLLNNLIVPIDGIYNCQLIYPYQAIKFLINAKIIHYFSSSSIAGHLEIKKNQFLKSIRKDGINEIVIEFTKNIKIEFLKGILFLMDEEKENYYNPLNVLARKISKVFPFINKVLNKLFFLFN